MIMKKIAVFLLLALTGVLGFGYYRFFYVPPLPQAVGAKTENFTWQYKDQSYSLYETLYQSIDDYYAKRPKGIYQGIENVSIDKYMSLSDKSPEVGNLTNKIKLIAKNHNLNDDQALELAVSFIQTIPYDNVRAKTDLTHPRYPYEVLYEDKGICSDKTLLAVSVLRSLGYGTAVFMWDKEQHMAAAVECPMRYSNYNSGYCIVETTAIGAKIGVIPDLSPDNLKAVGRTTKTNFGNQTQTKVTKLQDVQIYDKETGKTYQGILARINIEKEIASIESYLANQKTVINASQTELDVLKNRLDTYYRNQDFASYNLLVPTYNNKVNLMKNEISAYNQKVDRYNYLIKQ